MGEDTEIVVFDYEAYVTEVVPAFVDVFRGRQVVDCLGPGQFIGRSRTVSGYAELLPELGVNQDDPLVSLLAALGKRGFIISYWFGSGFEGANGWLDPGETEDLARRLANLKLPSYEVSFAAMEQFRGPDGYECARFSFEALSLSFVRTVATIAAADGSGVLWSNGLMPAEGYSWATKST